MKYFIGAIAVFLVLAACTTATPVPTPTIPAPMPTLIQGPFLTEAEVIGIAATYGKDICSWYVGKLNGSTARFTGFIWVVTLFPGCTLTIHDRTGLLVR